MVALAINKISQWKNKCQQTNKFSCNPHGRVREMEGDGVFAGLKIEVDPTQTFCRTDFRAPPIYFGDPAGPVVSWNSDRGRIVEYLNSPLFASALFPLTSPVGLTT